MCEWPDPDRDSHPRRMAGRGGFQEFMLQHNMAALQLHTFPARVQGAREALSSDEYRLKQTCETLAALHRDLRVIQRLHLKHKKLHEKLRRRK